jgi:hypothetical protein
LHKYRAWNGCEAARQREAAGMLLRLPAGTTETWFVQGNG